VDWKLISGLPQAVSAAANKVAIIDGIRLIRHGNFFRKERNSKYLSNNLDRSGVHRRRKIISSQAHASYDIAKLETID